MMLNKEMLVKALKESIYEDTNEEEPSQLKSWEEVHDECLFLYFNGIRVEEHKIMYGEMLSIINNNWQEIANKVNDFIDEECQSYYGDSAFSSAADYWGYILG